MDELAFTPLHCGSDRFLQAYLDKKHPEHRDMVEWVGEHFDPELFDLDVVNGMLG